MEAYAQRPQHLEHSSELWVAIWRQCLVKTLPPKAGLPSDLRDGRLDIPVLRVLVTTSEQDHGPLVGPELFDHVQVLLRRNSGRSMTLAAKPQREYMLKGLVRCARCGMPMWAQTFTNGQTYYREHRGSRGTGACADMERSIPCHVVDDEVGRIVSAIRLPPDWLDAVLARISLRDEVSRVKAERERVQERLRRLAKAFVDGLVDEPDYDRQKLRYEMELESLVVPAADAVAEAGRLVERLPELWAAANLTDRRRLLLTVLDGVYVDRTADSVAVTVRPKAAFQTVMHQAFATASA